MVDVTKVSVDEHEGIRVHGMKVRIADGLSSKESKD